jgi:hypothetical protein
LVALLVLVVSALPVSAQEDAPTRPSRNSAVVGIDYGRITTPVTEIVPGLRRLETPLGAGRCPLSWNFDIDQAAWRRHAATVAVQRPLVEDFAPAHDTLVEALNVLADVDRRLPLAAALCTVSLPDRRAEGAQLVTELWDQILAAELMFALAQQLADEALLALPE